MNDALLKHFGEQAYFCSLFGSPFTAELISRMAQDIEGGGPTARLVADWPTNPRADVVALRLTGALHAAVLTGRAPDLALRYPAQDPHWSMDAVWPVARSVLDREEGWVREFIASPPQTNETRRTIGLLLGFLTVAEQFPAPIDVLEIGASAGLNTNWDSFHYRTHSWSWGPDSPVTIDTEWHGAPPPLKAPLQVRHRAACDQNPLDITDLQQRLRLRSYVWADQADRLARFDGAVALALAHGVHVDRADAGDWLERKLAVRAKDVPTVVYHSVFYQYPPPATQRRIADLIEAAGKAGPAPLVWLRLEPEAVLGGPRDSLRMLIDTVTWSGEGREGERRILGVTDGHVRSVIVSEE